MADIFGITEENNYIDVTKRDSAANTMEMVIAGTGGYSGKKYDGNTYLDIDKIRVKKNNLLADRRKNYNNKKIYEEELAKLQDNLSFDNIEREIELKNKLKEIDNNIEELDDKIYNNNVLQIHTNSDMLKQSNPNNLVSSEDEHRIHDGQKRYKTFGRITSSNYPRPKTLFKVFFNDGFFTELGEDSAYLKKDLSDFVMEIKKPSVTYTTEEMNQYNRKKIVYKNVKYGELKITFIDTKDNPIQNFFFAYMQKNNFDFYDNKENDEKYRNYYETPSNYINENPTKWGLNIDSNTKIFDSITVCEMFLNNIMVYTYENPKFKSISFGNDKIGDYSYNTIEVTFDIEGITNNLHVNGYNEDTKEKIGAFIAECPNKEELTEILGMRWGGGENGEKKKFDYKDEYKDIYGKRTRNDQIKETNEYLNKLNSEIHKISDLGIQVTSPNLLNKKRTDELINELNFEIQKARKKERENESKVFDYNHYKFCEGIGGSDTYMKLIGEQIENKERNDSIEEYEKTQYNWNIDYRDQPVSTKYVFLCDGTDVGESNGFNDIGRLFAPRYKQLTDLFKF